MGLVILMGFIFIFIGSPGYSKEVVPEGVQDHQHFHSRTKAIGDYHAQLVVNHRRGKIFVNIYDILEDPKKISAKSIEALMTLPKGNEKKLSFKPDTVEGRRKKRTNTYYVQGDWIKSVHEFNIKFKIPIGSKIYEVSYAYKTSDLEDIHHKHEDCGKDCDYY